MGDPERRERGCSESPQAEERVPATQRPPLPSPGRAAVGGSELSLSRTDPRHPPTRGELNHSWKVHRRGEELTFVSGWRWRWRWEEAGNPPLPAPSAGWRGQRGNSPASDCGVGGRRAQAGGPGGTGVAALPPPPPRCAPPRPAPSLTASNFVSCARERPSRRVGGHRRRARSPGPRTQAARARVGSHRRPPPLPPGASPHPPRLARRRRSARLRRPASRRGGPGAPGGVGGRPEGAPRVPGRGGRTGAARPTLLVSSLLRSIRARVRDSIRDIIPRSGGRGASGARGGTQASDCGGGGGGRGAPHASVGDRKSDSPRPAPAPVPQTESPPPGAGRGGGAEQGGCPRGRRRGRAGAAGVLRGAAGRLRVPGAPGPGDAPRGSGLLTATPRPPSPGRSPRVAPHPAPSSPGNPRPVPSWPRGASKPAEHRPLLRLGAGWGEGGEV